MGRYSWAQIILLNLDFRSLDPWMVEIWFMYRVSKAYFKVATTIDLRQAGDVLDITPVYILIRVP
jgi:hypothetical protein